MLYDGFTGFASDAPRRGAGRGPRRFAIKRRRAAAAPSGSRIGPDGKSHPLPTPRSAVDQKQIDVASEGGRAEKRRRATTASSGRARARQRCPFDAPARDHRQIGPPNDCAIITGLGAGSSGPARRRSPCGDEDARSAARRAAPSAGLTIATLNPRMRRTRGEGTEVM